MLKIYITNNTNLKTNEQKFLNISGTCLAKSEKELIKKLLDEYQERGISGRPVHKNTDKVMLQYGLSLVQILDLDEQNQILSTNVWTTYVRMARFIDFFFFEHFIIISWCFF